MPDARAVGRCEGEKPLGRRPWTGRCTKPATCVLVFVWGSLMLCEGCAEKA